MATGSTAAGPDSPVGSSPLRRSSLPALVGWFKEVSDFIRSLVPSAATAFEEVVDLSITDTSNFDFFSGNARFALRRYGKVVEVYGDLTCTTAGFIAGIEAKQFGLIPEGFRPRYQKRVLAVGYGDNTVLLTINPDGTMSASRHTGTQPANTWLPIDFTYTTA